MVSAGGGLLDGKMNWNWQCAYCGIWTDDNIPLLIEFSKKHRKQAFCCSDECKYKAILFYKHMKRMYPLFLVLITISVIVFIAGIFYFMLFSLGLLLLGVVVFIFPFATYEQFAEYGVKKTVRLIRIIGTILATILNLPFIILSFIL